MITAYRKRLVDNDPAAQLACARAWSLWEGQTIRLLPNPANAAKHSNDAFSLAFARTEKHYFVHGGWVDEGQLIRDAGHAFNEPGILKLLVEATDRFAC